MKQTEKKTVPKPCICGRPAVMVKSKSGKMFTCSDPLRCSRNIRTAWHRSGGADGMIIEWNRLVDQAKYEERRKANDARRTKSL